MDVCLFVSSSDVFIHRLSAYVIFWMDQNTMYQHAEVVLYMDYHISWIHFTTVWLWRKKTLGPLHGSSSPFSPLSWRGLNPIKPVYDPDWPDGWFDLTASAFNQLGQYTSSPGRRAYCYPELAVFFRSGGHNHRQYSLRLGLPTVLERPGSSWNWLTVSRVLGEAHFVPDMWKLTIGYGYMAVH